MEVTESSLRDRYESLSTDQLIELNTSDSLTGLAQRVLGEVLQSRGLSEEDIGTQTERQREETQELRRVSGTAWLKFCAYFQYPLSGIAMLFTGLDRPTSAVPQAMLVALPLAIFCFAIAWGLHRRRFWAWIANWVVLLATSAIVVLGMLHDGSLGFAVSLAGAGGYLWANLIYWKKRRHLFT